MMLQLCEASLCLASPGLTLLLTFCTAMESTPGQDRTGELQRVRLTSQPLDHRCFCCTQAKLIRALASKMTTAAAASSQSDPGQVLG